MEYKKVAFVPNVPTTVTMKYDTPKTGQATGKDGKQFTWYMYGCTQNGEEASFFASEGLHQRLSGLGALTGRTLVINKAVDEQNVTRWTISENGAELDAQPVQTAPSTPSGGINDADLHASKYIQGMITKVNELESKTDFATL